MQASRHTHPIPRPYPWQTPEGAAEEWASIKLLPADRRETAMDVFLIKYGRAIRSWQRDAAIAASPNVIRISDAIAKLSKGD